MTIREQELLKQLEARVHQLILQDKDLQEQLQRMEEALAHRDVEIAHLGEEKAAAEQRYENLKMARILELGDGDVRNTRQRLSRLMREVDKCIALLKG